MTREEAKEFMWKENNKNPSVIQWQHHKTIRDLHDSLIDKIYADFKLELEAEYKRGWKDRHTQNDLEGRRCESCNIEKKRKRETHLCNTCALEFATCKSTIIFGDAPTKDNVYKCNAFREKDNIKKAILLRLIRA